MARCLEETVFEMAGFSKIANPFAIIGISFKILPTNLTILLD
jgi:hypothetical protein